jgi:hypothetical protein
MNDAVKNFITHFFKAIQSGNIYDITNDYEYGYLIIIDYFKSKLNI